jgi:hypothetical protein
MIPGGVGGYLDWDVHGDCDGDHNISSKDEENVVEKKTAKKNKASPERIELDILREK